MPEDAPVDPTYVVKLGSTKPGAALAASLYFYYAGTMETHSALMALAGLAQETRLAIFRLLVAQGPEGLHAGGIAEQLAIPNATLSFHLKELVHAHLVQARQAGRFIHYSANYTTVNELVGYLTENCCRGVTCDIGCPPGSAVEKQGGMKHVATVRGR